MSTRRGPASKRALQELLRELLDQPETQSEDPDEISPWHELTDDGSPHPWLSSATDLLISWFPDTGAETGTRARPVPRQAWDDYFTIPAAAPPLTQGNMGAAGAPTWGGESWDAQAAESAVDCLFRFIHAMELGDLAAMMGCIHPDYQVVEDGREIDREALRLDLESLLDKCRGGAASITLTEVPDPIFHPAGILIFTTIQMDLPTAARQQTASVLLGRLCVFHESSPGEWLISAMASVHRAAA